MVVSTTASIFSIVDNVNSNVKRNAELRTRAQAARLKSMATPRASAGTMTLIRNGLSRRKVSILI